MWVHVIYRPLLWGYRQNIRCGRCFTAGKRVPAGLSVALDARGFIASDAQGLTFLPRVYAIGEVTQKQHPCIATAMAEGVVAAKAIANTLACE